MRADEDGDKVGSVSASRYAQIVAALRMLVETASRIQFAIGDYALEAEPMRESRVRQPGEERGAAHSEGVAVPADRGHRGVVLDGGQVRWTASRWPEEHRVTGVSYTVHRIWAGIAGEVERFEAIGTPPEGKPQWMPEEANRRAGRQVVRPITPQDKVSAIHTLAKDEEVLATVTGDLLRSRP
ncbi:DUF6192 family protein [Streptomyces sp. NPDC002176]|uniref:DUF6192 family protein n=1 Tax=Streptomyces sp. NPDC002176 TaxID=3364634 RepID=UPI00384CD2BE